MVKWNNRFKRENLSENQLYKTFPSRRANRKRQRGLSGWGMMIVGMMVAVYGVVFFKLFSIYIDGWAVQRVLNKLADEPEVFGLSKKEISLTVRKRIGMNNTTTVPLDKIEVTEKKDVIIVRLNYDARVNLFGNLDAVAHFDYSAEGRAPK